MTPQLLVTLLSSFRTNSEHSLAHSYFVLYSDTIIVSGTGNVGVTTKILAVVVIIVADTLAGGGFRNRVTSRTDGIPGVAVVEPSVGAELAGPGLHAAVLGAVPAQRGGAAGAGEAGVGAHAAAHEVGAVVVRPLLVVAVVGVAAGVAVPRHLGLHILLTFSIARFRLVQSSASGADNPPILESAVAARTRRHAAVVLGVPVAEVRVAALAGNCLLRANVPAPVPTFVLGTVF